MSEQSLQTSQTRCYSLIVTSRKVTEGAKSKISIQVWQNKKEKGFLKVIYVRAVGREVPGLVKRVMPICQASATRSKDTKVRKNTKVRKSSYKHRGKPPMPETV